MSNEIENVGDVSNKQAGKILQRMRDDLKNEIEGIDISVECLINEMNAKRRRKIACEKALSLIPVLLVE